MKSFMVSSKFFVIFVALFSQSFFVNCLKESNNILNRTLDNNFSLNTTLKSKKSFYYSECYSKIDKPCYQLSAECLNCKFNYSCIYGTKINTTCSISENVKCTGAQEFESTYLCSYCYQLPIENYTCTKAPACKPLTKYLTTCSVKREIICLGNRKFPKFVECRVTSNIKHSNFLIISILFGGFGIDRFYLGSWQEGLGKLFSFGGIGIWSLIDIICIWVGYLKPSDGLYI